MRFMHRGIWRCTEVCRGMQWCIDGCTEGLVKVSRGTQRLHRGIQGAQRYMEGFVEVHGGTQEVHKSGQRYTEVC